MNRTALENRARALAVQRHVLRDKKLSFNSRFPEGTAVVVEAGGLSVLYRGQIMLAVDVQGQVASPLSDDGLRDMLVILEGVLRPATAKA